MTDKVMLTEKYQYIRVGEERYTVGDTVFWNLRKIKGYIKQIELDNKEGRISIFCDFSKDLPYCYNIELEPEDITPQYIVDSNRAIKYHDTLFVVGDNIEVTQGSYEGLKGKIIRIQKANNLDPNITIHCDLSNNPDISEFWKDYYKNISFIWGLRPPYDILPLKHYEE